MDIKGYIQKLVIFEELRKNIVQEAILRFNPPEGSRGLDAGCGAGLNTIQLAEAIGPSGKVTGFDLEQEFITYADHLVKEKGLEHIIQFQQGDIMDLPFPDNHFDWFWSMDCAGYGTEDNLRHMKEWVRVVKPGGLLCLLMYSSQTLLGIHPLLEARLNGTNAGISPFTIGRPSEDHYLSAAGWFKEAGLINVSAVPLTAGFYAPLSDKVRKGLLLLIEMRWPETEKEMSSADREI
ncbi:MAG: class I SAM-dependent methyltransferase, partial [Candidatus Aminicenantes bacterium]|nr:class I SAM-dependent methyltransferase [Candidatus Aminicenantes bacterium]